MHSFINRPIFGDGYMNNDIAIIVVDGYEFTLDSQFNLSN